MAVPGKRVVEPNPLYPDEDYEQFVSRMIVEKRKRLNECLICIENNNICALIKKETLKTLIYAFKFMKLDKFPFVELTAN